MENQQLLTSELSHRLAAIDIGTNSLRLIIAEALRHGNYRILDDEKASTRLGRNLEATGHLSEEAMAETLNALRHMKQIAEGYQVRKLRAIATCAVREAANGDKFCKRVLDEIGLKVEVISARKEARLAFFGVQRAFDLEGKNVAITDIGGGSTEIVLASGSMVEEIYTTPLGAVRLTEMFPVKGPQDPMYDQLVRHVDKELKRQTGKLLFVPHLLIGSGGTFTTLGAMVMASVGKQDLPVQGFLVSHADVQHQLSRLCKLGPKNRRSIPGLSADRADIILAGLVVIERILRRLKVNRLQIHTGGVRDGLLLTMADKVFGETTASSQEFRAVLERFAAKCGVDLPHGRHVAKLATSLFDQLADRFKLEPTHRPHLEAAALLQDVGYLINYDQHHKHSFHLILNSRLPGFRPDELKFIATIARYHRGAIPKKKHAGYRELTSGERRQVRLLAAILRLAGGLDRSHTQQVGGATCRWSSDDHLILAAESVDLPEVDILGARRRAEFFQVAFGAELEVEWQPVIDPAASKTPVADEATRTSKGTVNRSGVTVRSRLDGRES